MNTSQSITAYPSPPLKASIPPASPTLTESLAVSKHFSGSQLTSAAYIPPPTPEQLTMPEVSYSTTYTTALGNDEESAPSSESSSSSSSPAPSSASSSVSEHSNSNQRYQLHDNPVPGPKAAVATLRATQSHEVLSIIPPKSEDWAALIGEPQSPVEFQYQTHSMPYDGAAYTASPAAENGTEASTDYMQAYQPQQHQPRQASDDQYQMHTSTDPSGMQWHAYPYQYQHHNSPYGHYQNHGSTPSVPLADAATVRNDSYRRSLSTSEILRGSSPNLSTYPHGYLTPPRSGDDTMPRSRPSSGAKQFSVATSISLADASILAKYRESAIKTNDPSTQLSFAKYLLDISEHYPSEPYSSLSSVSTSSVTEIHGQQHPHRTLSESSDSASPTPDQQPSPSPPNSATIQQSPNGSRRQFIEEAKFLIDRLAKEGQPEAQFIRGSWYEEGLYDTKKNVDKALRWYLSASKGDFGPAHYKVAYFWEKKRDNNKSVMMYKKAAIHNNALANHRLAMVYFFGELNQSKNLKTGLEYLKRAAALATETAPMSPYVLGLILSREYKPINIPDDIAFPDDGEALEWFRKSAQLGHGPANYKLGTCYEYGNLGCSVDPFLSIRHYELAVLAGDSNGEAEMALSGWYLSGSGNYFAADDHLAFQYASLAAEKQLPKAQYAMGYYYEMGISVEIDMDKAMEFYKMAAANGSKDAMKRLEEPSSAPSHTRLRSSIKRGKKNRSRNAKEQSCSIM
ncbi:hypothetical protein BGZ99_003695 [Dissophora globulifera]|uniref:HCP-like protein n=1 Tax=Dissophora globulifera TaxID=979702 RepID=A0A9P6UW17_9FUNG|nr:hypothetical protein BGZ99_003695 [Dissophora globulifera]